MKSIILKVSLASLALVCSATAATHDSFKDIAKFEVGDTAMFIGSVLRPDLDRRGNIRLKAPQLGSTLTFRSQDWDFIVKATPEALAVARKLTPGQSRKIATVESTGGNTLRIEAINTENHPALRLTCKDAPGGKYPDIVFILPADEFDRFQQAVTDVVKEFTAPKLKGYY